MAERGTVRGATAFLVPEVRMDTRVEDLEYTETVNRRQRRPPSTYFPQDNVPFSYNSKPVPELFLTDFSDGPGDDQEASASEVILDWSTKVREWLNTDHC